MTTEQRTELEKIINCHAKKYPLMQPTDAVKLIYQNEFGPGHLISDETRCFEYLLDEYSRLRQTEGELFEPIGNGIVRVFLNTMEYNDVTPKQLFELFAASSKEVKGNISSFEEKLSVLKEQCEKGIFSFSVNELEEYVMVCKEKGYPAVSHSDVYRKAYAPAYRIIKEDLLK